MKILTIPEAEMLEKISMKLEQQDRKIIIIPDKPDKFPDVRQDHKKGISYIHSEGDNGLEQSKTPAKQKNEPDTEPYVKATLIQLVEIPYTPCRDHSLNPRRR